MDLHEKHFTFYGQCFITGTLLNEDFSSCHFFPLSSPILACFLINPTALVKFVWMDLEHNYFKLCSIDKLATTSSLGHQKRYSDSFF